MMKLSKNFSLAEFEYSDTAKSLRIHNKAPMHTIDRMIELCQTILEGIRIGVGEPILITSGYRSPALNKAVKGSRSSQHMKGEAADITCKRSTVADIMKVAIMQDLPYHQLIDEFDSWVHVSIAPKGQKPRKEILRFRKQKGATIKTEMRATDYV